MAIDSNTKLLLQFEGDQSSYGHHIIFKYGSGDPKLVVASKKFGGSSLAPNGGWVSIGDHASLDFGTGDFTIEMFFKNPGTTAKQIPISKRVSSSTNGWHIGRDDSSDLHFWHEQSGNIVSVLQAVADDYFDDEWHHMAVVRLSGTTTFYLDGTAMDTSTASYSLTNTYSMIIGMNGLVTSSQWDGNLDEVRLSDTARYNGNFTPTTTKFSSDANTVFLWHCEGDATGNHDVQIPSDVVFAANNKKFGGRLNISGTTNIGRVEIAPHGDFNFGSDDWTIDWWQRHNSSYAGRHDSFNFPGSVSYVDLNSNSTMLSINGSSTWESDSVSWTTGIWFHKAIVKSGTTVTIYLNGVAKDTRTNVSTVNATSGNLKIGSWGNDVLSGSIDEFRVSKGIARWTSNFTPPAAAYDQIGYGISGNTAAETEITIFRSSDGEVLHRETVAIGDYEVEFNETGEVDVMSRPTGDGEPSVFTNVTPVDL